MEQQYDFYGLGIKYGKSRQEEIERALSDYELNYGKEAAVQFLKGVEKGMELNAFLSQYDSVPMTRINGDVFGVNPIQDNIETLEQEVVVKKDLGGEDYVNSYNIHR